MGIDSVFIRTVLYLVVLYLFSIGDITMERMRASGGGGVTETFSLTHSPNISPLSLSLPLHLPTLPCLSPFSLTSRSLSHGCCGNTLFT